MTMVLGIARTAMIERRACASCTARLTNIIVRNSITVHEGPSMQPGKMTLADHCRAFYAGRGIELPLRGLRGFDEAYRLWATWAFSDMDGKTPAKQLETMQDIEAWEANHNQSP